MIKYNWTLTELEELHHFSLLKLLSIAHHVHTQYHPPHKIQVCSLISLKTGGCPEDCKYCPQSSRYSTAVKAQPLLSLEEALSQAKKAVAQGAARICLGAAWREVRDNYQFEQILKIVSAIASLGVEVCCTLGMLKAHQAARLKEAGLFAYNHNLDSSASFYPTIITTRTYQDRLNTLDVIQKSGLSVCCGGILGMGETIKDRLELIQTLASRQPHPDSVPINRLYRIPGTPLENQPPFPFWEQLRCIAIARIAMPKAMIRLSCGRNELSIEQQALCFMAGANSLFAGEKLLTVANSALDADEEMFQILGINL